MEKEIEKKEVTLVEMETETGESEYILDIPIDRLIKHLVGETLYEDDIENPVKIILKGKEMISYKDKVIDIGDDE